MSMSQILLHRDHVVLHFPLLFFFFFFFFVFCLFVFLAGCAMFTVNLPLFERRLDMTEILLTEADVF